MPETSALRMLDRRDLAKLGICFSRGHIWRLEATGQFPRHIKLTDNGRCAWVESEVHDWLRERIERSRTGGRAA